MLVIQNYRIVPTLKTRTRSQRGCSIWWLVQDNYLHQVGKENLQGLPKEEQGQGCWNIKNIDGDKPKAGSAVAKSNETSTNESSFLQYLPLFWPVRQSDLICPKLEGEQSPHSYWRPCENVAEALVINLDPEWILNLCKYTSCKHCLFWAIFKIVKNWCWKLKFLLFRIPSHCLNC